MEKGAERPRVVVERIERPFAENAAGARIFIVAPRAIVDVNAGKGA
jgi:hypothetical protein